METKKEFRTVREVLESGEHTYSYNGGFAADLISTVGQVLCYVKQAGEDWKPENEGDTTALEMLNSKLRIV